ncbi:hypothetical protein FT663_01290 [Candidozyma haemuli var. vulneris]|uniref:Uncharacterized protein n=1 Tax=Candidozyma haemuli TaxID=45357 RepID=A0A2V1AX99_9ASCO|nr:hypothetical protein CXQ85_004967 [[Candida] haemuloni]KAF3992155.1 hypothetical protein FT662_01325 [[Candida] haemuloni var. vulneris]KAF3994600.1 hypothetical protein FT663_01290 [[Candida] haemuloni var. vulneris]PVH22399.1 hypothetical protein CXQ85_004967 [[Candida] haemuloni]
MGKNGKRRSLQSLFGSPDRTRTGVAQVARTGSASQVRPPRAMADIHPFTASMNSLVSSQAAVSVDEFADTDSGSSNHSGISGHSKAEAQDAETIYSIISGYEDEDRRESNFVFMEDFSHNSGSPDKTRASASSGDTEPNAAGTTFGSPQETTASYNTPHASVQGSSSYHQSMSSAELLGRLRSVEVGSNSGSNSGSSGRGRFSGSSRSSNSRGGSRVSFSTRSRDSRGINNLTAGIDSSSGLPVTLYTVQDAEHQPNRWSLFAKNGAPQQEVPPVPGEGSSSSNSAPDSQRNSRTVFSPSKVEPAHYGPFSGSASDHPHHSVATVSTRVLENEHGTMSDRSVIFGVEGQSTPYGSAPASPQSSRVTDTESRRSAHNDMYADDSSDLYNYDIEKSAAFLQDDEAHTAQPWAKWALLMIMGLVAVPIYFLLAFGYFDFGGYRNYLPRVPFGPVNRRYFACYTYWQKLWSFVIGLIWLCLVFAAIAIAFGLRARFH